MKKVKFGDVVNRIDGNEDRLTTDRLYYIGGEHYDSESLEIDRYGLISEKDLGYQFHYPFEPGDVLFMTKNPHLKKAGRVSVQGICSIASFVLRTVDENILSQNYLPIIMQSDNLWNYLEANKSGSVNYFITWKTLSKYEFELPNIQKQKQISDIVWAMNRVKKGYQKLLHETDELVKSQFIEMFGDGSVTASSWETDTLENIFEITSSKRILKTEWISEGIPFLRVRDMVQLANGEPLTNEFFVSEQFYADMESKGETVKAGDIIVSATSTIGKTYVIKDGEKFYFKDADVLQFRKKVEIESDFFAYGINMPTVKDQIDKGLGGTTVKHFIIANAKKIIQPLPPLDLQRKFVALLKQADKSKFETEQALSNILVLMNVYINQSVQL